MTAWIAALWSGEYDKVQYALRTENGFCVNGVLIDQLQKLEPLGFSWEKHNSRSRQDDEYELFKDGRGISKNTVPSKIAEGLDMNELIWRKKLVDAFETALDREYPLTKDPDKLASITGFLINLNDVATTTEVTFEEMGHVVYQIAVDVLEVDLPPKGEIKALADEGSCDLDTDKQESSVRPRRAASTHASPSLTIVE
jgi:hypothetical protein